MFGSNVWSSQLKALLYHYCFKNKKKKNNRSFWPLSFSFLLLFSSFLLESVAASASCAPTQLSCLPLLPCSAAAVSQIIFYIDKKHKICMIKINLHTTGCSAKLCKTFCRILCRTTSRVAYPCNSASLFLDRLTKKSIFTNVKFTSNPPFKIAECHYGISIEFCEA